MDLDQIDPDDRRITEDHQAMAGQIKAIQALAATATPDPEGFVAALRRLAELSSAHFADEEAVMAARGYGGLTAHRQDHGYLLRSLGALISACEERTLTISAEIAAPLGNWLNFHVTRYDDPFRHFISDS